MTALNAPLARQLGGRWGIPLFAALLFLLPMVAGQALLALDLPWVPLLLACAVAVIGFLVWPIRSLLIFALFILVIDTIELSAGPQIKYADEVLAPVFAAITAFRRRSVIRERLWWPRETAFAFVAAAGVVSSIAAGVAPQTWIQGLGLLLKTFAVFYVALLLEVTTADFRWAARVVLGFGIVILILGAVELVAPTLFTSVGIEPFDARAGLPAIKAIFYHPQLFGWFCGLVALFLFAHQVVLGRRWLAVLGLLFTIGTIMSARRRAIAAVAAAVAGGAGLEVLKGRSDLRARLFRWLPSTVGVAVLALVFLPSLTGLYAMTIERYVQRPPGGSGGGGGGGLSEAIAEEARPALYLGSMRIAADYFPLGAGLGRFGSWTSREQYSDLYRQYGLDRVHGLSPQNPRFLTDTFWPQVLGETGLVGTVAYGAFLAALAWQLHAITRRTDLPPPIAAMALGAALAFGQALVESLASAIFSSPAQVYLLMVAVAAVMSWVVAHDRERQLVAQQGQG